MTLPDALQYLTGPVGALVFTLASLWGILKAKVVVPYYVYEESLKRIDALDAEHQRQSESMDAQTEVNAKLREEMAGMRVELRSAREEINRLRLELERVKGDR